MPKRLASILMAAATLTQCVKRLEHLQQSGNKMQHAQSEVGGQRVVRPDQYCDRVAIAKSCQCYGMLYLTQTFCGCFLNNPQCG